MVLCVCARMSACTLLVTTQPMARVTPGNGNFSQNSGYFRIHCGVQPGLLVRGEKRQTARELIFQLIFNLGRTTGTTEDHK